MSQSLSKVYTHIIFSTKHRRHLIDESIDTDLFNYLGGVCKALECNPVQVGGYRNHVHILCLLSRKISQKKLLEEIKKRSSKWIKTKDSRYSEFYWSRKSGVMVFFQSSLLKLIGLLSIYVTRKNIMRICLLRRSLEGFLKLIILSSTNDMCGIERRISPASGLRQADGL